MGILLLIIPVISPKEGFLYNLCMFFWILFLVSEIIIIVWHVNYNKQKKIKNPGDSSFTPKQYSKSNDINKSAYDNINSLTTEKNKVESNISCPKYIDYKNELWFLKYNYKELLCFVDNLDQIKLNQSVQFRLDETNEYDSNTVAVIKNNKVIGLMYKGDCRDILIKCLKTNKYVVGAWIVKKDIENREVKIIVGFYELPNYDNSFITSLIKTSKKDILTDEKRSEQFYSINEGDIVTLSESYDADGLVVSNEFGNELGEISESSKNKILEKTNKDIEDIVAIIESIESNYDDKYKIKIRIRIFY